MLQIYNSISAFGNAKITLFVSMVIMSQSPFSSGQSCGPRVNARLFVGIPCDMSHSSFCTAPGSAYPWNSLRRYIYENQGLMKRMYGDERHSSILQYDVHRRSYSPWNHNKIRTGRVSLPTPQSVGILLEPELEVTTDLPNNLNISTTETNDANSNQDLTPKELAWNKDITTPLSSTQANEKDIDGSTNTANYTEDIDEVTSISQPDAGFTTTESEYQDDYDSSPFLKHNSAATPATSASTMGVTATSRPTTTSSTTAEPSQTPVYEKIFYSSPHETKHAMTSNSVEEKEKTKPEVVEVTKPLEEKKPEMKGFNACPVKEEVIAPYWANNTRGETLALLNVYPFEQYVHWEKCSYENHQMFCKEGCRCEQQYRLHRLLAFDPRNECRGIFADWFRFPSCCICVCYNPGSLL